MCARKTSRAGSSRSVNVEPILSSQSLRDLKDALDATLTIGNVKSVRVNVNIRGPSVIVEPVLPPESQQDLDDALDETPTSEGVKKAWVDENVRDLYRAFAAGRKAEPVPPNRCIEGYSAVEGTEDDLRNVLGNIYEKYGRLAMYDKGVDNLAHHLVVGYQSIRGKQTVRKVLLYVSGTEWTSASPDEDEWAVVENPVKGVGAKRYGPWSWPRGMVNTVLTLSRLAQMEVEPIGLAGPPPLPLSSQSVPSSAKQTLQA